MKAMILAAGFGTRLWPLTIDRTKPAIPFFGKPLVGYVAEYLSSYGFKDVVVNLHHRPESVKEALGDGSRFGVNLHYVLEKEILGTSGALDNAKDLLADDTFLVINGKIVTDIDLEEAYQAHKKSKALATMVLLPNARRERFSEVITENGEVKGFGGMPVNKFPSDNESVNVSQLQTQSLNPQSPNLSIPNPQSPNLSIPNLSIPNPSIPNLSIPNPSIPNLSISQSPIEDVPLMFTGIQFLEPKIFDYIPQGVFSHSTTDVYPMAWANKEVIGAHIAKGTWYELSTIERYLEISLIVNEGKENGVIKGERNMISNDAIVRDTILWDDVRIEAGANIINSIIGDGVFIGEKESFSNKAIVRADLVLDTEPPEKALKGHFIGDNFVVNLTQ